MKVSLHPKRARRKSVLTRALGSVNKRFYRYVQNGMFGRYLSGYDASCNRLWKTMADRNEKKKARLDDCINDGLIAEQLPREAEGIVAYQSDSIHSTRRDRFAENFDKSKLVCGARKFKAALLNTPMVTYGLVVFGFALFLLISQALTLFFSAFEVPLGVLSYVTSADTVLTVAYMAAAVVLMALSMIWIFAQEGSLASFIVKSVLIGWLVNATMGVNQITKPHRDGKILRRGYAFFIGVFLGCLTFFVTPYRFFIGLLFLIFVIVVLNVPEFGLIACIFSLPYLSFLEHPTVISAFVTVLLIVSTLLKLLRGKRTYRVEPLDLFVLLFLLLVLAGGIVTVGGTQSLTAALTMALLGSIYFVITVLIRDTAWMRRCINALLASSVPVSVLAILEFTLGKAATSWQDTAVFSALSGRAASLWGNPNVLAEFLLVTFFVSLGCLLAKKQPASKFVALSTLLLNGAALIFTWSRGAWVALAVALIWVLLLYSHKTLPFVFLGILAFAAAFVFLPETFASRVISIVTFSDSSTIYRVHIWQGCASLIREVFLSGVGVGSEAFSAAYLPHALPGIESAPHAHNLMMQIVIEMGVVGLLVFVIMIVTVVRVTFTLFAKCRMNHSASLHALGFFGALVALLLHGMTDYIWYNYRIFMLFFMLIGLLAASRRIGAQSLTEAVREADSCDVDLVVRR